MKVVSSFLGLSRSVGEVAGFLGCFVLFGTGGKGFEGTDGVIGGVSRGFDGPACWMGSRG